MILVIGIWGPDNWRSFRESNGLFNSVARSHKVASVIWPVILRDGLSDSSGSLSLNCVLHCTR